MRIGCVVMASGEGRRFAEALACEGVPTQRVLSGQGEGGKLAALLGGIPLIERTVRSVLAAGERAPFDIVVSTRWHEVARRCERLGVRVALHDGGLRSESVRAGLAAGLDRWDGCLFLPGDQPLVSPKSFEGLYAAFASDPHTAVRLGCEGAPGSPVLFPARLFPELMHLSGTQGGGAVLSQAGRVGIVEASSPIELMDVDTPCDLAVLERWLPEAAG